MPPPGPDEVEIRTTNSAHETTVIIPGDALFDFNKDQIRTEDQARREGGTANEPMLRKAGEVIKSHPASAILIRGHTDAIGGDIYNLDLSQRRARNVAQWLVSNRYVEADRVKWIGLGKRFPVASNKNAKGRKKNRRVEIKIFA
jgi:outer membrane protein OmpA-like peptidoglycan-associated protein